MQIDTKNTDDYIRHIPEAHQEPFKKLREIIRQNLPKGFEEQMTYGMIGYVVPHSIYPEGYHVDPSLPLGMIAIASQKNFIAFYHMCLYADPVLNNWFKEEYSKHSNYKPDMGKSCVRLKKTDDIPYSLIAELVRKVSVKDWISVYDQNKPKKKSCSSQSSVV